MLAGGPAGVLTGGPAGTPSGGPTGVLSGGPAGTPSGGPAGVLAGGPAGMLSGGPAGRLPGTPGVALAATTAVVVVSWHPERASAWAAASSARGDGTIASSGIGRVGRRPGEHGRSGAPVVGNTVLERTVGSAPDGERHRLDVPVHRLLHVRLPVRNLTGKRWRTRARKVVHLRGLSGNCRVATDRARRGDPGGRKGQCSDTCRRTDDCDTRVKTSDQQADTSCNIALIHTQLHRPNHLRGYGPSWRMSPTASTCWPVPPCPSVFRPPCG